MVMSVSKGEASFSGSLVQSAPNIDTWVQIPTGIDPGSGTVILLESFQVYLRNGHSAVVPSNDSSIAVGVSRSPVVPSLANIDVFGMLAISSSFVNIGAVAAYTENMALEVLLETDLEPALTLQPFIYVGVSTTGLSQALNIDYRVTYSTDKMKGSTLLTLLASGA